MIKKKVPLWFYIFIISLFLIVMAVSSCSTPAKLNEKAYQRVLTDSTMFRSIGQKWARLQPPCTNDTIIGDTEVLILSDTTILPGVTDTIVRPDTIRIAITRTNTVTQYVVDNRAIHELQDTMHARDTRIAKLTGQLGEKDNTILQQKAEIRAEGKRANINWWLFTGLLVLAIGSHLIKFIPSVSKLFKN